ncbi:acetyl-CoA hydrolase (plasmid) [Paraburkholderia sp. D15]|uniref:acetyl-CoA hydrolase/transferase family protein n=1 Tax=Paraburkholderia sp. D15 TaxID=2880218 RepID=UPI00247A6BEB|nr:acetyl-CoA hydrolase/transferase C-terminal domain-containing protein [Paraburkholderia sp. D15]WGS54876.1 acetyl-CoA hydrolase [Paraburkholderia sp. D15]
MLTDSLPDLTPYLRGGDTVMWGQATAEPLTLTRALVAQRAHFGCLDLFLGIDLSGTIRTEHTDHFRFMSYCGAGGNRALAKAGLLDIIPAPYSLLLRELARAGMGIDVVLVQVAEADEDGMHSLGLANDLLIAAIEQARVVIAEVNPNVPRTYGERRLRPDEIDAFVPAAFAPLETASSVPSPQEERIAEHVASLVEDGATLQVGLGGVAEATLRRLTDRKDLGIHSGIVGDALVDLAESGALTNARKGRNTGRSVAGILMGTKRLYAYANRNPDIQLRGTDETHGAEALSSIERFVAINSAIEVDLTGQANSEVANGDYIGAVGGAPDFLRAAHRSRGGIPVIALRSTAGERSRIVASLSGPASTARCDAGVIVTENGIADLRGCSLTERMRRMIAIAAPQHREQLECRSQLMGNSP